MKYALPLCVCFFSLFNIGFAQQPRLVLPIGHTNNINSVFVSRDNKKIITSSDDKTAKIWDMNTGNLLLELKHTKPVEFASYCSNNNKIITIAEEIKLWDAKTGEFLVDIPLNGEERFAGLTPDGQKLLTLYADTCSIRDINTGRVLMLLQTGTELDELQFSADSKYAIGSSGADSTIIVLNISEGKTERIVKHDHWTRFVQISPDGGTALLVSAKDEVAAWDIKNGQMKFRLKAHSSAINTLRFSPDGKKFITASSDETAKIWDVKTGKLLLEIDGHYNYVLDAKFSYDGKKIITSSLDSTSKIWDSESGALFFILRSKFPIQSALFSYDGKKVITNTSWKRNNFLTVWDAERGNYMHYMKGRGYVYHDIDISPDGTQLLTASSDTLINIWDLGSARKVYNLKGHKDGVTNVKFSIDGQKIISYSLDTTVKIWNALNQKLLFSLSGPEIDKYDRKIDLRFSKDGKTIYAARDNKIKNWYLNSGTLVIGAEALNSWYYANIFSEIVSPDSSIAIAYDQDNGTQLSKLQVVPLPFLGPASIKQLIGHSSGINYATFDKTGDYILTASYDHSAILWDARSLKKIFSLIGHRAAVKIAKFNPAKSQIITASDDYTFKIWNASTGKEIISVLSLNETDYISQIPSGYYQCSPAAAKLLHYVTKDLKVITFEQLDVKYNRPDKVLEAIGSTDTALIKSYRKAYEKRIKKLGIDTTAFRSGYSVPEADFTNRENIAVEQKDGKLKLNITSFDSTYPVDRFNIWVNETPLFGQRGIGIRKRNKNDFDTTINIDLSQGENKIETSITNVNGTESYRMPLLVNYTPLVKQKEKTYFIGIGIDKFSDSKYNLKYSTKDIRDLAKKLKKKYKADIIIDTLFNEKVTISNIKALKQKLLQTTVNDRVIISYSGHGMLSKDFDYYLSTYAVNFEVPEENGLPYDELESLLDSIPARKKLMLIDACHSGEVDKDDLIALDAIDKKLIKGLKPVAYKTGGRLGLKNSFELMQSLFVNVGKSTGATIISAAAGTQFALEGVDNLPNGVFTYCILEAMTTYPSMKISELKKIVGERVVEITKGLQKPTSRNETIAVDWRIW